MENALAAVPVSTAVSEINAFELTIQEHETELDFIPDMGTEESRKASDSALKSARKTYKAIDSVRLEKKKEAEQIANEIHRLGKSALKRLEDKYEPHKQALDSYKAEQKRIEEDRKQQFYDSCQWLHDLAGAAQFSSTAEIKAMIAEMESKDQENTGLDLNKDQRFEYGKIHLATKPKLERALQQRIMQDAEEERQRQSAIELAAQQEEMRQKQEELERQQREMEKQQAAQDAKLKAERDAEERVAAAELAAKQAAEREEEAKKQAAVDAENSRVAEEARKIEEAERLRQATADAAEAERQRMEQERIREEQAAAAREANNRHKGKIHSGIVAELMAKGLSEDHAKMAVKVMAASQFVTINY